MQTTVTAPTTKTQENLFKIRCLDKKENIGLSAYADLIVRDKNGRIAAIRFGGYPEHVRGITDAIHVGCTFSVKVSGKTLPLFSDKPNGYCKKLAYDGLYAESILYLKDDDPQSLSLTGDDGEEVTVNAKRNLYIFSADMSKEALFRELDRKLSVPLIPEFMDYFLTRLEALSILNPLKVWSPHFPFSAWHLEVSEEETEIADVLTNGLKTGAISIPGANGKKGGFNGIDGFTAYLKTFAGKIAGRIKSAFTPRFDPEKDDLCERLLEVNQYIKDHAGYGLYPAQLACSESIKRVLDKDNVGLIVAECGTGKSKIGASSLYASQKNKSLNAIICPSHMSKKWVRELDETLPNTKTVRIKSMLDVDKAYQMFQNGTDTVYMVLSKERARDGYMRRPAVIWSAAKHGYLCPVCGSVTQMDLLDDGTRYTINADQFFFMKENSKNHKCRECDALLWSALNPDVNAPEKTPWVKLGEYGFVYRKFAGRHLERCKNEKAKETLEKLIRDPNMIIRARGAVRRYPLSAYIKQSIGRLDGLICDELHEYSGDSGQGQAMAELAGIAKKVIGMTATLINGYSKGVFHLLFRLKSRLMILDNKSYNNPEDFCREYGVVEAVYEMSDDPYNTNSRSRKRKLRERFLPGVSPLVYSRFLMNNAVFLSLNDMGKELPEYEEIPVTLSMPNEVETEYYRIEDVLKAFMKDERKYAMKIMSRYLNLLSAYPDQAYGHEPILHPKTKDPLILPMDIGDFETVNEKDLKVLEIVERKVKSGERVIVFTAWTRLDTQQKLLKLISEKGYRTKVLHASVKPEDREEWVDKEVATGLDVLITNPILVQTGLDLNAFTSLIFYNVAYNLFAFRQASRRSWRINQKAPRIEVYMLYYAYSMQFRSMKLMASKLTAATVIEGNISDEGLAAMSDCEDMTSLLAKELTMGIKDEVDDLKDSFKKMAILKTAENTENVKNNEIEVIRSEEKTAISETSKIIPIKELPAKSKKQADDKEQLTIWDLIAG